MATTADISTAQLRNIFYIRSYCNNFLHRFRNYIALFTMLLFHHNDNVFVVIHIFNKRSAVAEMSDRLAKIDIGRRGGPLCSFRLSEGGAESPSNTMWPGSRPTSMPSFILNPSSRLAAIKRHRQTDRDRQTG